MISQNKDKGSVSVVHPDERYQTPLSLAVRAMERFGELVPDPEYLKFLDVGCGDIPIFGIALFHAHVLVGSTIHPVSFAVDKRDLITTNANINFFPSYYDKTFSETRFDDDTVTRFIGVSDVVLYGNPPFSEIRNILLWANSTFQTGYIYFLLKLEFLSPKRSGYARRDDLWQSFRPKCVIPMDRRPSWYAYTREKDFVRKTNSTDYAFYLWDISDPEAQTVIHDPISWDYTEDFEDKVYREFVGIDNPHRR